MTKIKSTTKQVQIHVCHSPTARTTNARRRSSDRGAQQRAASAQQRALEAELRLQQEQMREAHISRTTA